MTNLTGANLRGTNFEKVDLFDVVFVGVDLSNALNLEKCRFFGPSLIDHTTLQKSGSLPLKFLRGIGLPDNYIEHYPSILLDQAIQFYSCFISYSSKDEEFVERLHADLQANGIRCWFALEDLKIGDKIRSRIDDAIRMHDKLLLILSSNSILSDWVETEVESAKSFSMIATLRNEASH